MTRLEFVHEVQPGFGEHLARFWRIAVVASIGKHVVNAQHELLIPFGEVFDMTHIVSLAPKIIVSRNQAASSEPLMEAIRFKVFLDY